jgi:ABC-type uncharacterized transport system substrate-binding protein
MKPRWVRRAVILAVAIFVMQAGAGSGGTPRVGVLSPVADASFLDGLREGLRELGYVEGRTISFEYRSAEGQADRLPGLAAELSRIGVDVIVTTSPPGVRAAKQATRTIPVVIGAVDDAVEQGFVVSLARPGGNVTGSSWLNTELSAKRLQLLKEAIPAVSRVAVLREAVGGASAVRATATAARTLGLRLEILELREPDELAGAFAAMHRERMDALTVLHGPMLVAHLDRVVEFAARNGLPTIFADRRFVDAGGLMSYGPNLPAMYRRAAVYVDKILKGAKPADLPVEQPTQFDLVVNLRAAKALGLTIPPAVLARADEVIQ